MADPRRAMRQLVDGLYTLSQEERDHLRKTLDRVDDELRPAPPPPPPRPFAAIERLRWRVHDTHSVTEGPLRYHLSRASWHGGERPSLGTRLDLDGSLSLEWSSDYAANPLEFETVVSFRASGNIALSCRMIGEGELVVGWRYAGGLGMQRVLDMSWDRATVYDREPFSLPGSGIVLIRARALRARSRP